MKTEEFEGVLDDVLRKSREVLGDKEKEYSSGTDRLHNFKVAARLNNETPAQALWGMSTKHLVSIVDMVEGARLRPSRARLDEKIGDMINYLILLKAIFIEEGATE